MIGIGELNFRMLREYIGGAQRSTWILNKSKGKCLAWASGLFWAVMKLTGMATFWEPTGRPATIGQQKLLGRKSTASPSIRYISIKKSVRIIPIPIEKVSYIKADGHYSEIHLSNKQWELSTHSLDKLELLLPADFIRIHRSYLANLESAQEVRKYPGSKYELLLKDGISLPVGRSKAKNLENRMI